MTEPATFDLRGEAIEIILRTDGTIEIAWVDGTLATFRNASLAVLHMEDYGETSVFGALPH